MKKILENKVINSTKNNLIFGKCLFEQEENRKEFLIDYLKELKNIKFDHSPYCPLKGIYENKSEKEIHKLQDYFQDLRIYKNKSISLASIGIVFDKNVINTFCFF